MIKRTYIPNKHLAFWCVHFTALPTIAKFLPVVSKIVTEDSFMKSYVVDIKQNIIMDDARARFEIFKGLQDLFDSAIR